MWPYPYKYDKSKLRSALSLHRRGKFHSLLSLKAISCIKNNGTDISFNLSLEIDTIKTRLKLELKSARLSW